jgi:2-oxoglutarate dehydrogenase E2 component (dihydrolipoamide succinyltransferase)
MPVDIKVPAVGESITEGTLSRWLKADGDFVRVDEPVFELETEKATSEIPAPISGRLKILVPEGQTIAIGSVVGRLDEIKEGAAVPQASASSTNDTKRQTRLLGEDQPPSTPKSTVLAPERILSPAARKIASEQGLDARAVPGTGREGRVTKEDVLRHLQNRQTAKTAAPAREGTETGLVSRTATESRETRQRMSGIRMRIAERLVASQQTTATLTTFNEADLSAVTELRARYKERFRERYGSALGFTTFFVKAAVEALRQYPVVNARLEGTDMVYQHFYDIGVAVSTDKGLMVPVIRDADRLSFVEVESQIAGLAKKAREGKIAVSDLQGGTFTITNGGVFGSLISTPILNPPQSAILGMHAIQRRPVVVDDEIMVRPMMYLALSYDHRLIDGRDAVLFLVRIKECVENPERLLLEI